MDEDPDPEALFELLGDEYVRTIVTAASEGPMSVKELSEECDSALSTVYRRLDDLVEAGLVGERTKLSPDGSHHHVYETRLTQFTVRVAEGAFELRLEIERDPAERFATMWRDIRRT